MEADQLLQHLAQIEELAEEILTDKQQLVDLDSRRQKTREASRAISKDKKSQKSWVCLGNMFLKLPKKQTQQILEKDFSELDKEISKTSQNLKKKVSMLRELEHKENLKGFDLNPLSQEEIRALDPYL